MYPNSQQASTDCSSACIQSIPDTHKFQGGVGTSFSVARRLPTSLRFFTCPSDGITKHANKNAPPNKKVRKGILIMLSLKQGFTKRVQSFQSFQLNSRTCKFFLMPIFLRPGACQAVKWPANGPCSVTLNAVNARTPIKPAFSKAVFQSSFFSCRISSHHPSTNVVKAICTASFVAMALNGCV